jgi:hypothetical protein
MRREGAAAARCHPPEEAGNDRFGQEARLRSKQEKFDSGSCRGLASIGMLANPCAPANAQGATKGKTAGHCKLADFEQSWVHRRG